MSSPLKVLHISDIHMRPGQRRKQAWLRDLARWEPDLVVNTDGVVVDGGIAAFGLDDRTLTFEFSSEIG